MNILNFTYSFSVVHVRILWGHIWSLNISSHFSQKVLREIITISNLEHFGVKINLTTNVEIFCCVEFILIWRWSRNSMTANECSWNVGNAIEFNANEKLSHGLQSGVTNNWCFKIKPFEVFWHFVARITKWCNQHVWKH